MVRVLIPVVIIIVIVLGPVVWFAIRDSNKNQRFRDRTAMIQDENYLALEQAVSLLERINEQDDVMPALLSKHKEEAERIIASFEQRQLRKGK